jgi:hypothetical protein
MQKNHRRDENEYSDVPQNGRRNKGGIISRQQTAVAWTLIVALNEPAQNIREWHE